MSGNNTKYEETRVVGKKEFNIEELNKIEDNVEKLLEFYRDQIGIGVLEGDSIDPTLIKISISDAKKLHPNEFCGPWLNKGPSVDLENKYNIPDSTAYLLEGWDK